MKKNIICGLVVSGLILFNSPVSAITYFNGAGKQIDAAEYAKITDARTATIHKVLSDGYGDEKSEFKDPVLLRKKRIEQWKAYRNTKS
jgi:hypothetical protein